MRKKRLVRAGFWIALAIAALPVVVMYVLPLILPDRSGYDLTLTLSAPQREYKLGDTIPILFTLKNNGKTTFPETAPWSEKIPFLRGRHEWEEPTFEFDLQARHKDGRPCVSLSDAAIEYRRYGGGSIRVEGGKSLSKQTMLNGHVLIGEAGTYTVRCRLGGFQSEPIEITVRPRTEKEMEEHVAGLVQGYRKSVGGGGQYQALEGLIYARDWRAVSELLDSEYSRGGHLNEKAFQYYLPINAETKAMLVEAAMKRGLTERIFNALVRFGCSEEEMATVIRKALAQLSHLMGEIEIFEEFFLRDVS